MEKFFCGQCGYPNPLENNFCNKCGHPIKFDNARLVDEPKLPNINSTPNSYDILNEKLLKLILLSGYINLVCDIHQIQFIKYKEDEKLYLVLIKSDNASIEITNELERLDFVLVEENLVRNFEPINNIIPIDEIIDITKIVLEDIYKADPALIEYQEQFAFKFHNDDLIPNNLKIMNAKSDNKKMIFFIIGIMVIIGFYYYKTNIYVRDNHQATYHADETATNNVVTSGQPLKTEYFDVTVNSATISDEVNTGNEYSNIRSETGEKFLIINVTFKNTDNESRTILDGSVHIKYNGTDYNFDKSEPIMADGWGIFLDQINPLTSKTTKLVYKLPTEITGEAYYNPGRSESNQLIDVGSIK